MMMFLVKACQLANWVNPCRHTSQLKSPTQFDGFINQTLGHHLTDLTLFYKSLLSRLPIILITHVCFVYTEVAGHCVLTETVPSCCDKYERNWHFLKTKLKRKNWDINILFLRDEYRWLYGWLLQTQNCLLVCIFRRQHQGINHYILRPVLISN